MPDIIAISETKITYGQILVNVDINGYDFIHCDSTTKAGGVGIYIKKTLPYKQKSEINIKLSFVENIWIEVKAATGPIVVGVIGRLPTTRVNDYECFITNLCDIFTELCANNTAFYAVGDNNIDLMLINVNQNYRKYVNSILSTTTKSAIDLPTRITDHSKTLLDHIYVNDPKHSYKSGVLLCDLSDHMSTFVCISIKKPIVKNTKKFLIQDMKNFDLEEFLRTLNIKLYAANLNSIDSVHDAFDKFEEVLQNTANKFAPLKKASIREKKISQKPWLTCELLNKIKTKNNFSNNYTRNLIKTILKSTKNKEML